MFSIGLGEILLCLLVGVLALKPAQWATLWVNMRRLHRDIQAWRDSLHAETAKEVREQALQERITKAAAVSDVSDLLPKQ